jgi:CRP-like cAMP-binding protein
MFATVPATLNLMIPGLSEGSRSLLEWVTLKPCDVLEARGEAPAHVYFPVGCAVALLLPLTGGETGLAALVGPEGMVGVETFLGTGSRVTSAIAMVQSGGSAWRLPAGQFEYELTSNFALRQRLTRYTLALVSQMARTAACARQHAIEQQLSRWLLQSWDRTPERSLPLNPESVAALLGLNRDATYAALARIERGGGIACQGSELTLLDRSALEATVCSCYGAMRDSELRALLPDLLASEPPRQHDAVSID